MRHDVFKNKLALRIDVDYPDIAPAAVNYMLDVLDKHDSKATFFVVAASSRQALSLTGLFDTRYIHRLCRLKAWKLLFAEKSDDRLPDIIGEITRRGHEVAVHGYDHRWWMENIWNAPAEDIREQIRLAYTRFQSMAGEQHPAWGSPGWRTNEPTLDELKERSVQYFSECWGTSPFITRNAEKVWSDIPHLPITLPSLETLVTADRMQPGDAVSNILNRPDDRYDLAVTHDYYEGELRRDIFDYLIAGITERGWQAVTLNSLANEINSCKLQLPECELARRPVPGFMGEASWQVEDK